MNIGIIIRLGCYRPKQTSLPEGYHHKVSLRNAAGEKSD